MGLPKSINILGYTVPIKPIRKQDKGKLMGCFVPKTCTIHIDMSYSDDSQQETLLHEVMHCLVWLMGLQNHFKDNGKGQDFEESFITIFSPVLYQALKEIQCTPTS